MNKYLEKIAATADEQWKQHKQDTGVKKVLELPKGSYQARYAKFVQDPDVMIGELSAKDRAKILKSQKFWLKHSKDPKTKALVKKRGHIGGAVIGGWGGAMIPSKSIKGRALKAAVGAGIGAPLYAKALDAKRKSTLPGFEKRIKMLEAKKRQK